MLNFSKSAQLLTSLYCIMMGHFAHSMQQLQTVSSTVLSLPKQAKLIKPSSLEKRLSFHVWLSIRNQDKLVQFVKEVYNAASPLYQQFLTADDYNRDFAPMPEVEKKVQAFFIQQGMDATIVNHSIQVTGTVKQINQALHIKLNDYQYDHHTFHAFVHPPKLPLSVAQHVQELTDLNQFSYYRPNVSQTNVMDSSVESLDFKWPDVMQTALPTTLSLKGFTGTNLQTTYQLSNIPSVQGVPIDGAGQTLVIVDKCGTNGPDQILKDANQYFKVNGIKPFVTKGPLKNFAIINPDGTPFTSCSSAASYSQEIVLDVESSHTIAPGNNTVLVLSNSDVKSALMQVTQTLIQNHYSIAGFSNASVISNSWSSPEIYDPTLETALGAAAAAGISVNFSSGDCGDNTYPTAKKCTGSASSPKTEYPSSSAYVTAIGATALFVDANYQYAFETVWGTVKPTGTGYAYDGGTGGGISKLYPAVPWQNVISNFTAGGYGVINNSPGRALPDIAMLGDPQTGLLIISNGAVVQDGGTSLACPLFSSTLLLVNQVRALLQKSSPIGQAAPYLYQNIDLLQSRHALNLIVPPAQIISGATPPPAITIHNTPAPASAFMIKNTIIGWDSSLTVEPENQFWNDAVGVGSPNIPNFVMTMANL